jgi:hypothetical protein
MAPVARANEGVEMRLIAVLVAICALSQTAAAQTPDCKAIPDARTRLACYDRVAPPETSEKSAAAKPAGPLPARTSVSKIDSGKYVDTIGAEDALMNARLKNICRGC